jgi:hypothetical protein
MGRIAESGSICPDLCQEEKSSGAEGGKAMAKAHFYGQGYPYLEIKKLPGKLIVVEGTDGVGRSTQVELLRKWLEKNSYAVSDTGLAPVTPHPTWFEPSQERQHALPTNQQPLLCHRFC